MTAPDSPWSPSTLDQPPMRVGLIGYGYWGPNLARNVQASAGLDLAAIADADAARLARAGTAYPRAALTTSGRDVVRSPEIDAVFIATPPETHLALAKEALERGKDVLVEKPLALNAADAEELTRTARACGKTLMVDHTFLFSGAVRALKRYVDRGELGKLYYFDSTRINLGLFRSDSNVVWDLAPHDVSILLHLAGEPVTSVSAMGACHVDQSHENIAYLTLQFASSILAHIHVNWLAPVKIRKTIIGGSKKMVVYDDMEMSEKVKLYDSGADRVESREEAYRAFVEYRTGDVLVPKIEKSEALAVECDHFFRVARGLEASVSDGDLGLEVVRVLEAAEQSMRLGGIPVEVERACTPSLSLT